MENYIVSFSLCLMQITELLNLKQGVIQNIRKVCKVKQPYLANRK